ncbi:hypothetical protein J7T55_015666 [Diaporthe amygdali]|uniref:uncharacterized protein n=1 Tax=Phomopsis amygdali TaxID=1214568 RepID=UPI0022FE0DD6|nr:uncharacterized protein J7T55_015666 [Diaporthe amygdali]KAJ0120928.1 hypothetical protein J7T55_015666 [Diaporthe amygdali]
MLGNSTTSIGVYDDTRLHVRQAEWMAVLGLALGIIGLLQSGLFVYSAIMGLGKGQGDPGVPPEWGKPWPFTIATGLEGPKVNASEPLRGSGGPFPEIHLFNDVGDYIGISKDRNAYIGPNMPRALNIYPINRKEHEFQYATFAILEAKGRGRDPLCIVDLGIGSPNVSMHPVLRDADPVSQQLEALTKQFCGAIEKEGASVFNAYTARSCGAAWTHIPMDIINATTESAHDFFCNRPAVLSFWSRLPDKHKVPGLLVTDLGKRGEKTLNDTLREHEGKEKPGRPTPRGSVLSPHEDTITIARKLPSHGLSAIELCEDALSRGPDYVNLPEGKFCRMSDKTLWPTCDYHSPDGQRDNCFDAGSRQLVIGGKVTRSKPYSREINYPLE